MSDKDAREAPDDDDNWVTVGARPRQKAPPLPSAPAQSASGSRKKRQDQSTSTRRPEPRENDWQLVMRSRQALTKLRDEDFALTRLGQIHPGEPRKANPRPANRSRLGAKFPTNMTSDRPNRPPAALRRPVRLAMPKFDVPLRSEADFPSLRGGPEPAAPPATTTTTTERRRSSVALKLDESLRSMAGSAAQQGDSAAAATQTAAPMPPPPTIRTVAYSEAVSWRARPARKSERRDLVRGEIREDVAMLQTAAAQNKNATESSPAAADASTVSVLSGESPQKKKEKEKRLLKKAKKKESQLILARLNANKDTHVQLVTADAFERLHGAHGGRWRRNQGEAVDLRAADQYPSLAETAVSAAAAAAAAVAATAAAAVTAPASPQEDGSQEEPPPPDGREAGGVKTYSRMLRELPKTLPPPTDIKELIEAKDTKEAKRKAPKKRAPIETSIFDLAERMPTSRTRRAEARGVERATLKTSRRAVQSTRLTGNRLDSTVLVHKRGKERTKKKKPSLLKRVILRERAERRRRAGLESGAAALLAGLTVKETVPAEGEVQQEVGPAAQPTDGAGAATAQPDTAPAQTAETPRTTVVKQSATPPARNAETSQRQASGSAPAGAVHSSPPAPVQKSAWVVKQEPLSPAAPRSTTVETESAATLISGSTQKATVKIKQEQTPSVSLASASPDTKTTSSASGSIRQTSVCAKQEPASKKSSDNSSPETKQTGSPSTGSQQKLTAEVTKAIGYEKPVNSTASEPASDSKNPNSTDAGDSDDDAPPSRGPGYTPCVTVDPKVLIHSRKFREYCQQTLSPAIDESARLLLQDLTRFQDRLYNRDPIKARARRRLVFGLREVSKHLAIKKLACVILAPNIEKIETAGGLDEAVQRLLTLASEREVPLVFALKRRALGHACKKPVPVSCVGIFNYQGSEDNYKRLMQLTEAAQERYRAMVEQVGRALQPQPREEELSPADQLLGVIDGISRQNQPPPPPPVSEAAKDDPTHALLAKLRSVTLGSPVSG